MLPSTKPKRISFTLSKEAIDIFELISNIQNMSPKQVIDYICERLEGFDSKFFYEAITHKEDFVDYAGFKSYQDFNKNKTKKDYLNEIIFYYAFNHFGCPFIFKAVNEINIEFYSSDNFKKNAIKKNFYITENSLLILNKKEKDLKINKDYILDSAIKTYKKIANYEDIDLLNEMKFIKKRLDRCDIKDKLFDKINKLIDNDQLENNQRNKLKKVIHDFIKARENLLQFIESKFEISGYRS